MEKQCEGSLCEQVIAIIEAAGFEEEMYLFIDHGDEIYVDFDSKEAANYLIKIAEEKEWKDLLAASYLVFGKRHRVMFFLW